MKVDAEAPGWWARLRFCRVLLGFGVGAAVDGVNFCQPLSTFVNLVSTFVKFWSALARLGLRAGRRCCGERGMVRHSCSGVSVAGSGGKWGCAVVPACAGMTGGGAGVTEVRRGRSRGAGWRWWLVASHPPPNLPPGRGEGPEREGEKDWIRGKERRIGLEGRGEGLDWTEGEKDWIGGKERRIGLEGRREGLDWREGEEDWIGGKGRRIGLGGRGEGLDWGEG